MTGEGCSFWYWLYQRVRCPNCNEDLEAGSLASHRQDQHGVAQGYLKDLPHPHTHPPDEAGTYRILFPRAARDIA